MTQTEIWQLDETEHEWGIPNETITDKMDKMIRSAEKQGFIRGMTIAINHGWNRPDVMPEPNRNLVYLVWGDVYFIQTGYSTSIGKMVDTNLRGVFPLAWRYDNAQDIYELLKQNGTI